MAPSPPLGAASLSSWASTRLCDIALLGVLCLGAVFFEVLHAAKPLLAARPLLVDGVVGEPPDANGNAKQGTMMTMMLMLKMAMLKMAMVMVMMVIVLVMVMVRLMLDMVMVMAIVMALVIVVVIVMAMVMVIAMVMGH